MDFLNLLHKRLANSFPKINRYEHPYDYLNYFLNYPHQGIHLKVENSILDDDCRLSGGIDSLKMQPFNFLKGCIILGKNVSIGPHNFLRGPLFIGDNVKIGAFCEISNSIILNNTMITHQDVILSSIIGENCVIAAQVGFANNIFKHNTVRAYYKNNIKIVKNYGATLEDNVKISGQCGVSAGCHLTQGMIVPGKSVACRDCKIYKGITLPE